MKKVIAILLILVSILGLCACGGPLSKEINTADELAQTIAQNYSEDAEKKLLKTISKNTSIHHFFSEEEMMNGLIIKIKEQEGYIPNSFIYEIYKACNESSDWYNYLACDGAPLEFYSERNITNGGIYTSDFVTKKICDLFKDPQSVEIVDQIHFHFENIEEDAVVFPHPIKYQAIIKVRAKNGFGANITQGYLIEHDRGYYIVGEASYGDIFENMQVSKKYREGLKFTDSFD